jgi:hypothetical protein
MKKYFILLLVLLMLPMAAGAADVQSMIDKLPDVNVLQEMDMDAQRQIYDQTQAAYDAYMALPEEEKAALTGAEETFEALFGYFNTLVSPAEEVQEESGSGANILSTVIATAIGILLAQKIITKRNLRN